jgi:very-short-patch-repair endonuclease
LAEVSQKRWCPYCSNPPQKLCEDIDNCEICLSKTFQSHPKSKYWDKEKNGSLLPKHVFLNNHGKYWFICDKCLHNFESPIYSVSRGSWCPLCVNKTEQKVYDTLVQIYPNIQRQYKRGWCKNIKHLPFDFCIPDQKIIIEVDGDQHFKDISHWYSEYKVQQKNDVYKVTQANQNGYKVIRIYQMDIWEDKYDWVDVLHTYISQLSALSENVIQNVYISSVKTHYCIDPYHIDGTTSWFVVPSMYVLQLQT